MALVEALVRCPPFSQLPGLARAAEAAAGTEPETLRGQLLSALADHSGESVLPSEREAARIGALADPKGDRALDGLIASRVHPEGMQIFHAQPDALARSLWAYLNERRVFDAAESVIHLRLYRDTSKLYDAFELVDRVPLDLATIDALKLGSAVSRFLSLGLACTVNVFEMPTTDGEPKAVLC